jgi:hypothetical protein
MKQQISIFFNKITFCNQILNSESQRISSWLVLVIGTFTSQSLVGGGGRCVDPLIKGRQTKIHPTTNHHLPTVQPD